MLKHSLAILIATAVPAMAADNILSSHKVQFEHESLYLRGDKSGFGEGRPFHSFDPAGKIHPGVRASCDRPDGQELGRHLSNYLRRRHAAANHCPLTPQAVLGRLRHPWRSDAAQQEKPSEGCASGFSFGCCLAARKIKERDDHVR